MRKTTVRWLVLALTAVFSIGFSLAQTQACSSSTAGTLWAGQTKNVGSLTVENKLENGQQYLYVTYAFQSGVVVDELHLWVGRSLTDMPQTKPLKGSTYGNPIPGHFPYDIYDATPQNGAYVFRISLGSIFGTEDPCGKTVYVVAHAAIYVNGMQETAFAGSSSPCYINPPGRWWCYLAHVICCEGTPPQQLGCWKDETAWANGEPYNSGKGGNWALYTRYDGVSKTVNLLAGQTMDAGDVTLEPFDGGVKITVTLASGWRFAPVQDNLKVQDYSSAPSGNPAPGKFQYKTTCSSSAAACFITVPTNNFYGIHVDVEKAIPCP